MVPLPQLLQVLPTFPSNQIHTSFFFSLEYKQISKIIIIKNKIKANKLKQKSVKKKHKEHIDILKHTFTNIENPYK